MTPRTTRVRREVKMAASVDATTLDRVAFHMEFKALDAAQGLFEGYLAVFNNEDKTRDIIERGAFAKTLKEAYAVKTKNKSPYIFPLLFMHEANDPVGGIYDASEDAHGLLIKGQCDLDTERGRTVFSGMQKGYIGELSIGYNTVKSTRDAQGIRHLQEIRLWEGSAVTSGFAANPQALVVSTKTDKRAKAGRETKGACGKTSWPLAPRDRAWDGAGAHNRLVAWATKADDTLDAAKMQSVHFWYDSSAPDKITSYKLAFCDIVGGEVQAIPKGVQTCTGSRGIQGIQGVSSGDMSAIKGKIATYYNRMAKEFDDPTIVVPWDAGKLAWRRAVEQKMGGGLSQITSALASVDVLFDSIDACLAMIGDATGVDMDPDEGMEEGDVGGQLADEAKPGLDVQPAVSILLDNLDGLRDALVALATTGQAFDDAIDAAMALLGIPDSDVAMAEMAARPILDLKVGATFSAATKTRIAAVADGLEQHCATLREMVKGPDEGASVAPRGPTISSKARVPAEPEPRATTQPDASDPLEPVDEATLADSLADLLLSQRVSSIKWGR